MFTSSLLMIFDVNICTCDCLPGSYLPLIREGNKGIALYTITHDCFVHVSNQSWVSMNQKTPDRLFGLWAINYLVKFYYTRQCFILRALSTKLTQSSRPQSMWKSLGAHVRLDEIVLFTGHRRSFARTSTRMPDNQLILLVLEVICWFHCLIHIQADDSLFRSFVPPINNFSSLPTVLVDGQDTRDSSLFVALLSGILPNRFRWLSNDNPVVLIDRINWGLGQRHDRMMVVLVQGNDSFITLHDLASKYFSKQTELVPKKNARNSLTLSVPFCLVKTVR